MKTKITFYANQHDQANIETIKKLRPRWSNQIALSEGLRVLREHLTEVNTNPPTLTESAQDSINDLFGDN